MGKTRKSIIVIVEGPSDLATFESILENYFSDSSVHIDVIFGDITLSKDFNPNTLKEKLYRVVSDFCKYEGIPFGKNIIEIVQLVDIDGVYVDDDNVIEKEISHIEYDIDDMYTPNKERTLKRNFDKRAVLNKMSTMGVLNKIPFHVYYFSRNLEHALYNRIDDVSDEEKRNLAESFSSTYRDHLDDFLEFIHSSEIAVQGDYIDTWNFIKEDNNSLHRNSNFHILFDKKQILPDS